MDTALVPNLDIHAGACPQRHIHLRSHMPVKLGAVAVSIELLRPYLNKWDCLDRGNKEHLRIPMWAKMALARAYAKVQSVNKALLWLHE